MGFVGLVGLFIVAAKLFPAQGTGQERYMSAEQERACFNAHMSGDNKLASVICNPAQWRAGDKTR